MLTGPTGLRPAPGEGFGGARAHSTADHPPTLLRP